MTHPFFFTAANFFRTILSKLDLRAGYTLRRVCTAGRIFTSLLIVLLSKHGFLHLRKVLAAGEL